MRDELCEKVYWYIGLVLVCLSPWLIYSLARKEVFFSLDPNYVTAALFVGLFLIFFFEIGFTVLFRMASGAPLGLMVRDPTIEVTHTVEEGLDSYLDTTIRRLQDDGFEVQFAEEEATATIRKEQAPRAHSFIDHAFTGSFSCVAKELAFDVRMELTMNDTIIMETGETERLEGLAGYLIGKTGRYDRRSLSLTHGSALYTSFLVTLLGWLLPYSSPAHSTLLFSTATAALLLNIAVLFILLMNRKKLFGFRLLALMFCLSIAPFVALFV